MIKIYPRINSVIGATMDRLDVRRFASRGIKQEEDVFYSCLVKESGVSSNNPVRMLKNWHRAYVVNLKKNMMISELQEQMVPKTKGFWHKLGLK